MTREQLLQKFPHASNQFLEINADDSGLRAKIEEPDPRSGKRWTMIELQRVKDYYTTTPDAEFDPRQLAIQLGRSLAAIYLAACRCGVSYPKNRRRIEREDTRKLKSLRVFSNEQKAKIGAGVARWIRTHGHPRGMLGKKQSRRSIERMIATRGNWHPSPESVLNGMRTRIYRYGHAFPRQVRGSWKAGWREIGGKRIFARSRWEANYARFLEFKKGHGFIKEWEHEPKTFWFESVRRGCRSYLPDFRVTFPDGRIEYHEVKGWMDDRSKTKIKRMTIYYPGIVLRVFDGAWFRQNKNLRCFIPGWEGKNK